MIQLMKMMALIGMVSTQPVFATQTDEDPKFEFSCNCTTGKKACEALESMNVKVFDNRHIEVDVGDYEWEFNETFQAYLSKKSVPEKYARTYGRFDIPKSEREYLPDPYMTGDLLIMNAMKAGGIPKEINNKVVGVGVVQVIQSKTNRTKLTFSCKRF